MKGQVQNEEEKGKEGSGFFSELTRFFSGDNANAASSRQSTDTQRIQRKSTIIPPTHLDINPNIAAPGRPAFDETRRSMFVQIGQSIEQEASGLGHKTNLFVEEAIRHVKQGYSPIEATLIIEQSQGFVDTMVAEQHKNFKRVYDNGNVTKEEYARLLAEATEQGQKLKIGIEQQFQARLAGLNQSVNKAPAKPGEEDVLAAGNVLLSWLLKAIEIQRQALLSSEAYHQLSPSRRTYVRQEIATRLNRYQYNPPKTLEEQQEILHDLAKIRLTLHLIEYTKQIDSKLHDMHGQALNNDIFDYTGHQIDDAKVKEISLALRQECLLSLNLSNNQITAEGAKQIAKLVAASKNLHALILNNNPIGVLGLKYLLPALQQHCTLEYLDLQNIGLTAEAGDDLKTLVRHNRSLKVLSLSGADNGQGRCCKNKVEDAGVIKLAEGLKDNRCLRALDLNQNGITAKGVKAIGPSIGQLKGLDLSFNPIENAGFKIIMDNLSPDIEVLKVAGCGLTVLSTAYLALTVRNWPCLFNRLQELHLSHNPLGDEGVSYFIAALGDAESLDNLFKCYLRNTGELSTITLLNLHCHYDVLPQLTFFEFQSESVLERCQLQKMTQAPSERDKEAVMEGKKILVLQKDNQYSLGFCHAGKKNYQEIGIEQSKQATLYAQLDALPGNGEIKTPEIMKALFNLAANVGSISVADKIEHVLLEQAIDTRKRAWYYAEEAENASAPINLFTPSKEIFAALSRQKEIMEQRRTRGMARSTSLSPASSSSSSSTGHQELDRTVSEVMRR